MVILTLTHAQFNLLYDAVDRFVGQSKNLNDEHLVELWDKVMDVHIALAEET